jgi:hypothetical protein
MLIADGFGKHLGKHGTRDLDAEAGSVVGLWPDGRIGLLNQAWQSFARDNRGDAVLTRWPLGSEISSGISGVLRDYYARAFERVRVKGEPWEQTYLCDAPWRRREFRLRVLPLEGQALLLLHSLVVDVPHFEEAAEPSSLREYVGEAGMVHQCSNCRRTKRVRGPHGWDWVRSYIAQPPTNATQGICPTCIRQFYPEI